MIYKKCIMTINKNNATLDEDIYLFRLDKNIELHFTIVNNKYKFDKSDLNNIIAQTNAAYFQIRLYRSDEIKYTFAIQPTQDGVAVLTITDDLIDDPIELGEYDFQISLLDADKTSMISMPIVKQQLHVCEPLVDNQAIMGKAVLGLTNLASGEIKNAFDSEGNYIREIHKDGDILSAQLINKFEEALDTNTKASKDFATKKYVDDNKIAYTISSKVLGTLPASDIKLNNEITVNNISINKDRRYYIEFLGSKKLCNLLIDEEGNNVLCTIGNYKIQAYNDSTNMILVIDKINEDDTTATTFTDLVIYEEEVKYLDNKYIENDLQLQNSISLGRIGDIGAGSSAVGVSVLASGACSHAEGVNTTASDESAHAEGENTKATSLGSHAEGGGTIASGKYSHAEGNTTIASGDYSHAEGYDTTASSQCQHVQGKFNIEDTNNKYAHIVGNGKANNKSNAHTLDWQGNAWYSGKLSQEGTPTEDKDLTTKKYVDNIKTDINTIKTDLGTEELTTTAKNVKGAVNEVAAQYKDVATKTITTEERNKLTSLNNYDDTSIKNDIQVQKTRIDSLTTLTEGSTTGDAELIDGRTGADGVTYTNIGNAIRTQCGNLNTLLDIEYEPISNNCIDDSKFVGKNFDSIFGHSGNKKFKLDKKLTSSRLKGYIELEDGTQPSTAFQIYLASTIEGIDGIQLSIGGTYISAPNFDKYDIISVDCWSVYDKNIKTFFIGNYEDEYDNFKTRPKSKTINTMETKLTSIQPEQCSFFTKVNNLLKNVALQKGYGINPNYGMPDKLTGIERTTTDFMELRDDCKSTYCNINGYIYYYDENKKYLQSISPQNLETPAGIVALPQSATKIKYIRYTFVTEDDAALATYWITDQGKPYENDKLYIPKDIIEDMNNKTESWYKGKKICAYGDSVTEQNKWQSFVSSYFNCSFYNRGVGGTTVTQVNSSTNHMSADVRIETIPTDSDVVLVFGGHNDWSSASINIGDIKTDALSESVSFKSAFALMLKKIQTRCPNAKIITMTPVGGRTEEASTNQDKQFYIRDLCMTDFANAVKEVSAYYGIPCIDINANSGINTLNHTTYIADVIHPNLEGGKLIANEVINGLKRFEPIVF